jgi:hypothetical protein
VKRGRIAHACIGAAIVAGVDQAFPIVAPWLRLLAGVLVAAGAGALWEWPLQRWLARLFPWWSPRPEIRDWFAFVVGAGAAAMLIAAGVL